MRPTDDVEKRWALTAARTIVGTTGAVLLYAVLSSICNSLFINWGPDIPESEPFMSATILVVEDEPAIQALVVASLTHAGHRVLCADTGESAVRLISETLPDVVLLDWMLPGMSGI
jgi:Response regulator receiver domain